MTRYAGVDLRRGRLITWSSSMTTDGIAVANGTFEILPEEAPDGELGEAVGRMLDASREGIPTPDLRTTSPFAPVLAALGLRYYSAYARGTLTVNVERDDGRVTVVPTRNGGSRHGFEGLTDQRLVASDPGPEELGAAVRAGLARCTTV